VANGTRRCGACRFWQDSVTGRVVETGHGPALDGHCLRYPPVPVTGGDDARPAVHELEWCGEWQAADPRAPDAAARALARQTPAGDLEAARAPADRVRELSSGS
jgi:hypothetical protein